MSKKITNQEVLISNVELAIRRKEIKLPDYMSSEDFIRHAKRYIKAIKEGRVICSIGSVSKTGSSRTIKFLECDGNTKEGYRYYNFFGLFEALKYPPVKLTDYFRINGGGMDMIFQTNYNNIRVFYHLGLISLDECKMLEQKTPSVI